MKKRTRRSEEQLIADLEKQIAHIKVRAEQRKAKKSPAIRSMQTALKALDKALGESEDAATRKALGEARSTISACLSLNGATPSTLTAAKPGGRRSSDEVVELAAQLLAYVAKNPGHRAEQIANALGSDTGTIRLPMKKLIANRKVRTTGQKRAMAYFTV